MSAGDSEDSYNLVKYARKGNIKKFKKLISENVGLEREGLCRKHFSKDHYTCFSLFVDSSNFDKDKKTLLISSCNGGHYKCVKLLIEKGVDVNSIGIDDVIDNKKYDIINLLVKNGYDLNRKSYSIMTPIENAIISDNYECVKLLFSLGANIDILCVPVPIDRLIFHPEEYNEDIRGIDIVHFCVINVINIRIIKFLVSKGAKIEEETIKEMKRNCYTEYHIKTIRELKELNDNCELIKEPDCL